MLHSDQTAQSGSIQNVIVCPLPSYILIMNTSLHLIGKETRSSLSLLSDNPPLEVPFELSEDYCHRWEVCWIRAPPLRIILRLLSNVGDYIQGWRWDDIIQGKIAMDTTHCSLGTRCAVGLLDTINEAKGSVLFEFIAAFTHRAVGLLSLIGLTWWMCRPPSPLGSSQQPQSSQIF